MRMLDVEAIRARYESAKELINELHTERLSYSEYLTLINSTGDIYMLLNEVERLRIRDRTIEQAIRHRGDES